AGWADLRRGCVGHRRERTAVERATTGRTAIERTAWTTTERTAVDRDERTAAKRATTDRWSAHACGARTDEVDARRAVGAGTSGGRAPARADALRVTPEHIGRRSRVRMR